MTSEAPAPGDAPEDASAEIAASLGLTEAVLLAHAMVARVSAEAGVRALFIKGPVAVQQGLRTEHGSVDVDVLVDPATRPQLSRGLESLGWRDEHPYTSPTILPQHSLTYRHRLWPCELDVHDRFPGFFASPTEVFEQLWTRRTTAELAGQSLDCPDVVGHALVLALHALRDAQDPGKQAQLAEVVSRAAATLDGEQVVELGRLAAVLGAGDTALPFLVAVGAPTPGRGSTSTADLRAWHLRTNPRDPTAVPWVHALRHLPLRRWPRFLWYAVMLSEQELRLEQPNLPPGRRALLDARWRRLRRGMAALPGALRSTRDS